MIRAYLVALALALLPLGPAAADPYPPIPFQRYDLLNGSGQASGGTFNYWDTSYTGFGNRLVDGAPLSGGLGKLGDGIIGSLPGFFTANVAGTGPDVGWLTSVTPSPSVTFYFVIPPCVCFTLVLTGVDIWLDNSFIDGAAAPSAILLNGVSVPFAPAPFGGYGLVKLLDISHLINDTTPTLTFVAQDPGNPWILVSEVTFRGAFEPVPEPATLGLFALGLGTLLVARRRAGRPSRVSQAA